MTKSRRNTPARPAGAASVVAANAASAVASASGSASVALSASRPRRVKTAAATGAVPIERRAVDYRVDPFDLQLFEAVVAQGSITAGAQAMSLSLAAASARIQALEHRVGVRLLERSKTGAVATDAGRALSRQSHRVLAELDSLHVAMSAFGRGLRGTVRLLGNTAAIVEALPPRLGGFLAAHPDIDVELQEMASDAALQALREGVADVAIVADHVDTRGLDARPWLEDELVALVPAVGRRRASTRFVDLLDQSFVGLGADSGLSRFLLAQAARCGRVPHHRVRVSGFDAMAPLVAAGAGVAVMPRGAAERYLSPALRILRLDDPWARRTLLICHSAQAPSLPGVRALIEALSASGPVPPRARSNPEPNPEPNPNPNPNPKAKAKAKAKGRSASATRSTGARSASLPAPSRRGSRR